MSVVADETAGGEVILRFEGDFEARDAWKVHEVLGAAGARASVVLDFSQVRHFQDFAIALLAPDLATPGGSRVHLRGLGMHQLRILEYFGVSRPDGRELGEEPGEARS